MAMIVEFALHRIFALGSKVDVGRLITAEDPPFSFQRGGRAGGAFKVRETAGKSPALLAE